MSEVFHLYLIRHGQSANNALPESERVEDPGLTTIGVEQARRLADRFRDEPITHLLTSGFLRAVETMLPLSQAVDPNPEIWTDLHEVGGCFAGYEYGKLEGRPGMNRQTLSDRYPDYTLPDDIDHAGWWKSRPFEQFEDARRRAEQQSQRILQTFHGTSARVACVIHADFKALLLEALLQHEYGPYASADLVNAGVTRLVCRTDKVSVEEFNDSSHLPEDLVTS